MTEVSATELRLGIEGRVSPVEDKTWPPCRGQVRGQNGSQMKGGPDNQRVMKRITMVNTLCSFEVPGTVLGTFYTESTKL